MTLFIRDWRVTVGTLRVAAPLRVAFEIERTTRPQPNKATVRLFNLTRDHQAQIERATVAQVILDVGYRNDRGLETVFRGELFRARGSNPPSIHTQLSGVEAVTTIEARDGGRAYQRARVEQSFGPGVRVATVLRACADALGLGTGNVAEAATVARLEAGGDVYPEGTVLSGQASRELTRILRGLGLGWSVQHGSVQVLRRGAALQTQIVRLAPETGLVGSAEIGTRGRVKALALLTPDLWPGRRVQLESERASGQYVCRSVTYRGDSHTNEWHAHCELEPVGAVAPRQPAASAGGGIGGLAA